jgi:uncharacterized protein YlxW (UPF0749 family)
MGRQPAGWRAAVPVVLALAGLLFAASASTARGAALRDDTRRSGADLLAAEQARVAELAEQATALRAEVDRLTSRTASRNAGLAEARSRINRLAAQAQLRPVTGPGLTVTLDDAPVPGVDEPLPPGVTLDSYVVHQQDVQAVVNALWAGGAQAMQLQDQRVIATSAVRCVGPLLILQGRTYPPPYRITAIGDPDQLKEALDSSEAVATYRDYVDYIGLGYSVQVHDQVTVPGYTGPLQLHYARAAA